MCLACTLPEVPYYYDDGIKFQILKFPGDCTVFASLNDDVMAIGRGKNLWLKKALEILFEMDSNDRSYFTKCQKYFHDRYYKSKK